MKQSGFSLIELLIVISIIGVLAVIAIPQFANYRARSSDARAISDLRHGATAEESNFADVASYIACADAAACVAVLPGVNSFSNGVTISFAAANPQTAFVGTSTHAMGTGAIFTWDSLNGGLQ